jgi:hypothetical protein
MLSYFDTAFFRDRQSFPSSSGSWTPDMMFIDVPVPAGTARVLIQANLYIGYSSSVYCGFRLYQDGVFLADTAGNALGSRTSVHGVARAETATPIIPVPIQAVILNPPSGTLRYSVKGTSSANISIILNGERDGNDSPNTCVPASFISAWAFTS